MATIRIRIYQQAGAHLINIQKNIELVKTFHQNNQHYIGWASNSFGCDFDISIKKSHFIWLWYTDTIDNSKSIAYVSHIHEIIEQTLYATKHISIRLQTLYKSQKVIR